MKTIYKLYDYFLRSSNYNFTLSSILQSLCSASTHCLRLRVMQFNSVYVRLYLLMSCHNSTRNFLQQLPMMEIEDMNFGN